MTDNAHSHLAVRDHIVLICKQMIAAGTLPTPTLVHSRLKHERGGNPSLTTVKKGIDEFRANEMPKLARTRLVFAEHSDDVASAVEAMLDTVYGKAIEKATQTFEEASAAYEDRIAHALEGEAIAKNEAASMLESKSSLEKQVKELQDKLDATNAVNGKLHSELAAERNQRLRLEASFAQEREQIARQVADMKQAAESLELARKQLVVEKDQERTARQVADQARQAAENAADRARAEAAAKEKVIDALRTSLEEKSGEAGRVMGRLDEMQREVTDLRARLSEALRAKSTLAPAPAVKAASSPARRALAATARRKNRL
jgi:DNA repair exonuclease SbcCD ATPase subunit